MEFEWDENKRLKTLRERKIDFVDMIDKERIVRHTKEGLKKLKGKTDHVYVGNTSDDKICRQVENDLIAIYLRMKS